MGNFRDIWNHEKDQAGRIARRLLETNRAVKGWPRLLSPSLLIDLLRFRKIRSLTRKNLLFTKKLAFDASKEIFQGRDRALETGSVDMKTRQVLSREGKGFYTEKIRRRQLQEVEVLIDHYLGLLNSDGNNYEEMVKAAYPSRKEYLSFIQRLEEKEREVIQAALATVRKGSKKERLAWFAKVRDTAEEVRLEELERIFPATEAK